MKRSLSLLLGAMVIGALALVRSCESRDKRDGEAIVRRAISAVATRDSLMGVDIHVPDSIAVDARSTLAAPYTLRYVDNYLAGTSIRDNFATGWMVWEIRYSDGRLWEAWAVRDGSHWTVELRPSIVTSRGVAPSALPNQRLKLTARGGRPKGKRSILIAAAAGRSLSAIR